MYINLIIKVLKRFEYFIYEIVYLNILYMKLLIKVFKSLNICKIFGYVLFISYLIYYWIFDLKFFDFYGVVCCRFVIGVLFIVLCLG